MLKETSVMDSKEGRKWSVITLEKKLIIIREIKKNRKLQKCVSALYSIPNSTVADIWKDREKIETFVSASECSSFPKRRHVVREALFAKVDQACYIWFM